MEKAKCFQPRILRPEQIGSGGWGWGGRGNKFTCLAIGQDLNEFSFSEFSQSDSGARLSWRTFGFCEDSKW